MKIRTLRYYIASVPLLLVLLVAAGAAQPLRMPDDVIEDDRAVLVDYAIFPAENPEQLRLEIYYQIYNYALEFAPDSGRFKADYVVNVRVLDEDKVPAKTFNEEKSVTVSDMDRARSSTDYRVNQLSFDLDPGKYKVEFTLQVIGSRPVTSRDFDVKLEKFDSKYPKLSDIELVQAAGTIQEGQNPGPFRKGDLMVVPSLNGAFGGDENGRMFFYLEIHRGSDSSEAVTVETLLRGEDEGMVYRDSLTTPLAEPITRQLREISLADYPPDSYELTVSLHGRRYRELDKKSAEFRVPWTQYAILRWNYDTALDQLEVIADRKDVKPLRKIEDLAARKEAIEKFWAERDPDKTTPVNELQVVFYRRVDKANRLFSILRRDGWRTDRGRVLIRYGEPDQIDDYPFSMDRRPYQEWHYYRSGRYRKFVFVDYNEDGDYRLQYPYDGLNQRPEF